jgi:Flp pilus assembly protein TadD
VAGGAAVFALVGLMSNSALADARRQAADQDWAETADKSETARDWAPWSFQPWHQLALAQLGAGDRAGARDSLRRAIEKDPRNWELWFALARASAGRDADRALARARSLNPRSPNIAAYLAERREGGGG